MKRMILILVGITCFLLFPLLPSVFGQSETNVEGTEAAGAGANAAAASCGNVTLGSYGEEGMEAGNTNAELSYGSESVQTGYEYGYTDDTGTGYASSMPIDCATVDPEIPSCTPDNSFCCMGGEALSCVDPGGEDLQCTPYAP